MNPDDPESAHHIVAEFARLLETSEGQDLPASVEALPYPRQTIKAAILTCASSLDATGALTDEMRTFLEEVYVALADYVDDDLVRVMAEYRSALAALADTRSSGQRLQTPEWQRIVETGRLAGGIAKWIADDAAVLRREFRSHAVSPLQGEQTT